ncbi:MAG: sulfurtransferase complex subunit TusB [Gammaproteobacteria bacterium]
MSHLHTLNNPALLALCLRACQAGDSLILLEDGVYCAMDATLLEQLGELSVYALREDLAARGLQDRTQASVTTVSMTDFVRLCCDASRVINWF